MQVCMNCFNSSLVKGRAASAKAIFGAGPRVEAWEVDAGKPPLSIEAWREMLAILLLAKLISREFRHKLQRGQEPKIILTNRLISKKRDFKAFLNGLADLLGLEFLGL